MRAIIFVLAFIATFFVTLSVYCQERTKYVGMQMDIGAPDGVALGVVVKPVKVLRLNVSGTYNVLAPGVRGGMTLDPINFGIAPTLTIEGGYAAMGKIPGVSNSPQVGYTYLNLHGGLEFGKRDSWRIFLHAGPSWISLKASGVQSAIDLGNDFTMSDPRATVMFNPTVKLGFVALF